MDIREDDLTGGDIIKLLEEHLRCMAAVSPPASRHALDLTGLRRPEITFWTAWNGAELAGCGALKELDPLTGEIKSMRTAYGYQRRGVASQMLQHIMREAKRRGYHRLSLETGAMNYFEPARKLYARHGFVFCEAFAPYVADPNSVFMTREI
jgi:putative acetyltransferase